MSNYRFTPYVQAPNSPHVVWKQQYGLGGLIGGAVNQISIVLEADAVVPSIIYEGRMYQTVSKMSPTGTGSQNYWQCVDLRTGQLYWERILYPGETAPTLLTYEPGGNEVLGSEVFAGTWRVWLVAMTSPSGGNPGRVVKYNPMNGAVVANFTGPPTGVTAGTFYADPWVLSIQTIGSGATARYRLINWTIANNAGTTVVGAGLGAQPIVDNFTQRIWGNISWPFNSLGTDDFETGIAVVTQGITPTSTGVQTGTIAMAASLFTGQLLWNKTLDASTGFEDFATALPLADHGKFAIRNRDDAKEYCFDQNTGNLLWKSDLSGWPWGVFQAYDIQSAYGLILSNDYYGIRAIDWDTGKRVWEFTAPAVPFETPYGNYSWHSAGIVADGKLYTWNNEHTPSEPITRGWRLFCINVTTGEGIWNMSYSSNVGGGRSFAGAFADGYLAVSNSYDATMYIIGKGKSATTVTAPDVVVSKGTGVVIKGTVLDVSPAQVGTPCVSQDSMSTQMEYLHMQHPIDGIWHNVTMTGVPVILTAIDESGGSANIGTATTSAYYGTYEMAWTPPAEGTYKIIASFAGDDSYGSSGASTAVSVGPAPPEITIPEQITPLDYTMTIIYAAVAIIFAVFVAVALAILILRKR
jgi:outer membrane protein assembly factor BamB